MLRRCPQEITLVRSGPQAAREQQTLLPEHADRLDGAASARKGLKDQTDGMLHLNVGIAADGSVGPVDQTDRRAHLELAAPGLVELATTHPRFEDVQLGLAHRAFEAEQKAIVEAGRIVDAVFVKNERRGQRAQLDKAVPVGRVARKTRDLQAHDDAGLAERHLAHELLEAVACCRTRSGLAEIAIDDVNALDRPARGNCAIAQRILALRALAVLGDLAERRLANIEIGVALEMVGGDLELRHGRAPLRWRRGCRREAREVARCWRWIVRAEGASRWSQQAAAEWGSCPSARIHAAKPRRRRTPRPGQAVKLGTQYCGAQLLVAVRGIRRCDDQAGLSRFFLRASARSRLRRCTLTPKRASIASRHCEVVSSGLAALRSAHECNDLGGDLVAALGAPPARQQTERGQPSAGRSGPCRKSAG